MRPHLSHLTSITIVVEITRQLSQMDVDAGEKLGASAYSRM
ncbi:hypothetical protein [Brevibacillus sp. SYSU BS000544]